MSHAWVTLMYPYYNDFDMIMCPAAVRTWSELESYDDPQAAWDFRFLAEWITTEYDTYYKIGDKFAYSSYGKNPWVSEPSTGLRGG